MPAGSGGAGRGMDAGGADLLPLVAEGEGVDAAAAVVQQQRRPAEYSIALRHGNNPRGTLEASNAGSKAWFGGLDWWVGEKGGGGGKWGLSGTGNEGWVCHGEGKWKGCGAGWVVGGLGSPLVKLLERLGPRPDLPMHKQHPFVHLLLPSMPEN